MIIITCLIGYIIATIITYKHFAKEFENDSDILPNLLLATILGLFSWVGVLVFLIVFLIKQSRRII